MAVAGFARCPHIGNMLGTVLPILQKPGQSLLETRQALDHLVLQDFHSEVWNEADHGSDARQRDRAVGTQAVIRKAVLLVLESGTVKRVQGVGDGDKMLEGLRGYVLVAGFSLASSNALESIVAQ